MPEHLVAPLVAGVSEILLVTDPGFDFVGRLGERKNRGVKHVEGLVQIAKALEGGTAENPSRVETDHVELGP